MLCPMAAVRQGRWRGTDLTWGIAHTQWGRQRPLHQWAVSGQIWGCCGAFTTWLCFALPDACADAVSCVSGSCPIGWLWGVGRSPCFWHCPWWHHLWCTWLLGPFLGSSSLDLPSREGPAGGPFAGPKAGGWEQFSHPGTWVHIIPDPKRHLSGSTCTSLHAPEEMSGS